MSVPGTEENPISLNPRILDISFYGRLDIDPCGDVLGQKLTCSVESGDLDLSVTPLSVDTGICRFILSTNPFMFLFGRRVYLTPRCS